MSKVTNTARDEQHPEWTLGGNPRAIEAQEARGQQELVNSDVLPTDCDSSTRELLEAAGVVFGDPVKDDELFQNVTLPDGWAKKATDHAMWSDLVDAEDKVRARIFYKAAFYDRRAFIQSA